jgi:phage/plasmid-like protein (TIGR03299 family)
MPVHEEFTMAHQIKQMAYVGDAPWHGLGSRLTDNQPLEVWQREAGMDWHIQESPVYFNTGIAEDHDLRPYVEQKVLFRSDTHLPLSVVSQRYQVVQPRDVLEFYRDLTEMFGYQLETAGVLKEGRKFWALARTGHSTALKGNDVVDSYILLATSCDGTLATTATPTTVRVVCNNTLSIALNGASQAIKVPHSTRFDAVAVKRQLGLAVSNWETFMYGMKALAERKVNPTEAKDYIARVISGTTALSAMSAKVANLRALKRVTELYEGQGMGSDLPAAQGTAWGLLNAVTQYVDHERRARNSQFRMDSAWFGQGAALKQRALDVAFASIAV